MTDKKLCRRCFIPLNDKKCRCGKRHGKPSEIQPDYCRECEPWIENIYSIQNFENVL